MKALKPVHNRADDLPATLAELGSREIKACEGTETTPEECREGNHRDRVAERSKPVKALKQAGGVGGAVPPRGSGSREIKACEGTETPGEPVAFGQPVQGGSREIKACEGTETCRRCNSYS